MEQVILLVVIGLISLVNWMIQSSAEARKKRQMQERIDRGETEPEQPMAARRSEPIEQEPEGDPAENMRRLMEALGLPLEDAPPQPAQRQQTTPPPLPEQPRETMQPPSLVRTVREMEERGEMPVVGRRSPRPRSAPRLRSPHPGVAAQGGGDPQGRQRGRGGEGGQAFAGPPDAPAAGIPARRRHSQRNPWQTEGASIIRETTARHDAA